MANINLKYYKGEDLYSDGAIEDEILNMVNKNKNFVLPDDINYAFPILYHLSVMRENVLNWYPFKNKGSILEIGAGCGAITGLLCRKLKKVVSVELSKKRSQINYLRNIQYANLEIVVGNINEIVLAQKFDYVLLNGVLEYAISFTEGTSPYTKFLSNISRFLKPDGKIIIAIENRIGIKYFSGAPEDHTGNFFLSQRKYCNNKTVQTFTKSELQSLLNKCNFNFMRFYYPYPDYKFPYFIYTDETLERQKYGSLDFNLEPYRINFFEEMKMCKTLIQENVMDKFANSFIVEASSSDFFREKNVVFAKMNNDRKESFRLLTTIERDKEEYSVYKIPLSHACNPHLKKMKRLGENLNASLITYLKPKVQREALQYEFLPYETLQTKLQKALEKENTAEFLRLFQDFFAAVCEKAQKRDFYHTKKFRKAFGDEEIAGLNDCVQPANIDLIPENVFVNQTNYIIIDSEWVFEFPIPCSFIIWRSINEFYAQNCDADEVYAKKKLLKFFSISNEMEKIFKLWSLHFSENYVNSQYFRKYHVIPVEFDSSCIRDFVESNLYYDIGNGFNETNKLSVRWRAFPEKHFSVSYFLQDIKQDVKEIIALRWDPVERELCSCQLEGASAEIWRPQNADITETSEDIFSNLDPIYICTLSPEQIRQQQKIVIEGKLSIRA